MTSPSLYQQVMGADFERLHPALQAFHRLAGRHELRGWVQIEGRLLMRLERLRFLGIPCPRWLMPRVLAEETGDADRLLFKVEASLPWIGTVTRYRGHLVIPAADSR